MSASITQIVTNAIPGSNIGGGTVTTALYGFDVQAQLKIGPAASTVPHVAGVRSVISGLPQFASAITNLYSFRADAPSLAGVGVVSNQYGFYCPAIVIGTSKFGFFADDFTAGGYPLYISRGTSANAWIGPNTGIGGTAALAAAHPLVVVSQNAGSITAQIVGEANKEIVEIASFTSVPVPTLRGRGSRGTKASPTQTQSGDTLLRLAGTATDNAGTPAQTSIIAAIDLKAAQNITTSAQGTRIEFQMCPASSTTLTTCVTMEAGTVTIAGQTTPEIRLDSTGDTSEYLSVTRTSASGVSKALNHVLAPGQGYSITTAGAGTDFVEFGTSITSDTDGYSISFWARFPATGTQLTCFERGQDGSGNGWSTLIFKRSDDKMQFSIVNSSPAQVDCVGTSTLSANTWYHILCIFNNGNSLKLYVNGTLETTTATASATLRSSTVGWRGFLNNGAGAGVSFLDAIQIWKNVYVDSDASNLAAGGDPTTTPNFQYKINEGSGTTLTNTGSTGGNNGTLNGTVTWSTLFPSQNPLPPAGSTVQGNIWESRDGTVVDCAGIYKFGQPLGRTIQQGGQSLKRTVSAGDYTVKVSDCIIGITSTAAARTVNLPLAADAGDGMIVYVKDESGGAGTNNITIDGNGSETIDGALTKVINTNYGAVRLYCTGTTWFTF